MQTNRLSAKDLITVGIYTAMYLVIFFVTGMLGAIPHIVPCIVFTYSDIDRYSVYAVFNKDGTFRYDVDYEYYSRRILVFYGVYMACTIGIYRLRNPCRHSAQKRRLQEL